MIPNILNLVLAGIVCASGGFILGVYEESTLQIRPHHPSSPPGCSS